MEIKDNSSYKLPKFGSKETSSFKGRAKFLVYLNHFITGWDDNIWWFALGLFLVEITPESLTFTATYGLVAGGSVLLFGTVVGDWVDRTARLTVARVSVLVQNSSLILCCLLIYVVIQFKADIAAILPGEVLLMLSYGLIIAIAIVSNLTSMGRMTAIERDWIVEICDRDVDMLANLSATMRRISLFTMVFAPIVTGQILSRFSHATGALAIAGWNLLTIFLEYFLLWKIYQEVPQLRRAKFVDDHSTEMNISHMHGVEMAVEFNDILAEPEAKSSEEHSTKHSSSDPHSHSPKIDRARYSCITLMFSSFITLYKGWRIYQSYDVAFAGLALASLYLTVLGFDGITTGFAYSQGLGEDLIGGLLASAAATGIVGTLLYPRIRRSFGLQRTGMFALTAQISSLSLCVVSVFCPGSPFQPLFFTQPSAPYQGLPNKVGDPHFFNITSYPKTVSSDLMLNMSIMDDLSTSDILNATTTEPLISPNLTTLWPEIATGSKPPVSYVSISLLMAGIIGARVGLWMADLTIQQLFLETVAVTERGIVGGVQNALNQLMDMIKFAIVILLPVPEVFGYLVFISVCFIALGWALFAVYVKKSRGFICPWSR